MARIDPYRLASKLASMDMPDRNSGDLSGPDELLEALARNATNSGHYYSEPALLRRLCWWQGIELSVLEAWRDELVRRGEIEILPDGADCYSGRPINLTRIKYRNRHARWSGPVRPHIPASIRRAVYMRDGHACVTCHSTERLSLDHVVPYSHGGPDTVDNLQTMCVFCNARKGARV